MCSQLTLTNVSQMPANKTWRHLRISTSSESSQHFPRPVTTFPMNLGMSDQFPKKRVESEVIEAYPISIPKNTKPLPDALQGRNIKLVSNMHYQPRELIELLSESGNRWAINELSNSCITHERKVVAATDLPFQRLSRHLRQLL